MMTKIGMIVGDAVEEVEYESCARGEICHKQWNEGWFMATMHYSRSRQSSLALASQGKNTSQVALTHRLN